MPINDFGFLGTDIERLRLDILKRHDTAFTLARDVNAFWQRTKFRLDVHNRDGQEVLAASVLIKMLNDFQAAVVVLERGMIPQGQALLRCCLEALFILRRVSEDHEFIATWAKSDERDRLRMLTAVRDDAAGLPASIDPGELSQRIEQVQARVTEVGAKAVRVSDVMKTRAPGWFPSLYMLWSFPVHSAPRSLQEYVSQASDGSVSGFDWGPSERDLDEAIMWGVAVMLEAGPPIDAIFGLDLKDEMLGFDRRLRGLMMARRPAGGTQGTPDP